MITGKLYKIISTAFDFPVQIYSDSYYITGTARKRDAIIGYLNKNDIFMFLKEIKSETSIFVAEWQILHKNIVGYVFFDFKTRLAS